MTVRSEDEIMDTFPRGTAVVGPNGEKGIVRCLDRTPTTGSLGLLVQWEGSGVTAFTNAAYVEPVSLSGLD